MNAEPLPFVGHTRQRLVAQLLEHVHETAASNRPRLVTLEAGTGWGKTRLLQELYTRLAVEQPTPAYWPPAILGTTADEQLGLEARRKRLYPTAFTPPEGAVPHWFWWGITATAHRSGTAVQALAQDLTQVEAHTPALERRWRELASSGDKAARLLRGEDATELGTVLRDEGVGRAAEAIIGSTVPGLGFLLWAGGVVWRQRDRWTKSRRVPEHLDAAGVDRADLVTELASSLATFTAVGLPVIIALEDLHDADASLVDFLTQVLNAASGPILVIATAWPGLLEQPEVGASRLLADTSPARVHRCRQPRELPDLEDEALLTLTAHLLPESTAADRRLLTARFTTPLTLEIACAVHRIRDAVAHGDLLAKDVDDLPRDVEGLYRVVWGQLPAAVRDGLMLAALSTPQTIGEIFRNGSWDPELTATALRTLPWLDGAVHEALSEAGRSTATAYSWVRQVDDWLLRFHEPAQLDVAAQAAGEDLGRRRRQAVLEALAEHLDPASSDLAPSRRRWQAQMLLSLASEGFVDWAGPVWPSLDILVDESLEEPDVDSLRTAVALLRSAPLEDDSEQTLRRRRQLGDALRQLGHVNEAKAELEAVIELRETHGRLGAPYAVDLNALALALRGEGHLERSLTITELVVTVMEECMPGSLDLMVARHNRAVLLSLLHNHDVATRDLEELVTELGTYPDDDTRGLYHTARTSLAACYLRASDMMHAIFFSQTSAHMAEKVHGPRHRITLAALSMLAEVAWQAGAAELAREVAERLRATAPDVLGDEHPTTIGYRLLAESFHTTAPPAPPISLPPWSPEDETLLLIGRSTTDEEIYAFIRMPPKRIDLVKSELESGRVFTPEEWGYVVAGGTGVPTPRVTALTGIPEFLLYFRDKPET